MTRSAIVPPELTPRIAEIMLAFKNPADPVSWPEDKKVKSAFGPAKVAAIVINAFHPNLRRASIAYLWVEKMSKAGKTVLGTAAKCSAKVKLLSDYDFVITLNHEAFKTMTAEQKVAVLDHELCHCDIDSGSGSPTIIPHDVEEFTTIIRRWGLWKNDLLAFGQAVVDTQGDLFKPWDDAAPPPKASAVQPLAGVSAE